MRIAHRAFLSVVSAALAVAGAMAFAPPPAGAQPSGKPFEIIPGSFHVTPSTQQAGAHEDLTTSFDFAHSEATGRVFNDVRTTIVNLPAGFIGNNTAVPTCTDTQLFSLNETRLKGAAERGEEKLGGALTGCPIASQVGQITFDCTGCTTAVTPQKVTVPLYNMEVTSFGITAELGFKVAIVTQVLDITVRPGDSGLRGSF